MLVLSFIPFLNSSSRTLQLVRSSILNNCSLTIDPTMCNSKQHYAMIGQGSCHVSITLRKAYIGGQNSNMTMFGAEVVSTIDLGHTVFLYKTNGIVESQCADNFTYEVEHIAENLGHLKAIAGNGKLLMMNCVAPYTSLSAAARQYIAKGSQFDFIRAEAYVIHSVAQKMLATFFIRVDKPKVPTKFFLKKEEAELWLLQLPK